MLADKLTEINKEFNFALYCIKKNIENNAELRFSFVLSVLGMAINNTSFLVLWIYFVKAVGVVNGWQAIDMLGLISFATLGFGLTYSFAAGIRELPEFVIQGKFDRFMLSPKSVLLRVATASFANGALGDLVFGVTGLIIYLYMIDASLFQIMLAIVFSLISGFIYFGTAISIYSISFFFADGRFVCNSFFELFLTPGLFHGGAFQGVLRFIFTFLIPSLLVGTLPVEALRNFTLTKFCLIFAIMIFWLLFSVWFFNRAIKKYEGSSLIS